MVNLIQGRRAGVAQPLLVMKVQTLLASSFAFSLTSSLLVNLEGSTNGYLSVIAVIACVMLLVSRLFLPVNLEV